MGIGDTINGIFSCCKQLLNFSNMAGNLKMSISLQKKEKTKPYNSL